MISSHPVIRVLFSVALALQVSIPAQGQALFAITGAGNVQSLLYEISSINGSVLRTVGDTGTRHVTALAFNPTTGGLFGHVSDAPNTTQLISINPDTAVFSVIGNTSQQVPDMSFRTDGTLFAWSKLNTITNNPDDAYRINLATGQATFIGEANFPTSQAGLSFAPDGTLYLKNVNDLYTIDQTTGIPTFFKHLTGSQSLVNALAFDSSGKPYSVVRTGTQSFLATFDMNTGAITTLGEITAGGQSVNGVAALAFRMVAVPEPSSLLLAGSGLAVAGVMGWRWRQRKARSR